MQGLGETTAMVAKYRKLAGSLGIDKIDASMKATVMFGPNPGGLQMFSSCPSSLCLKAPLIVVLHGCGQDAESFAVNSGWLTLADRLGCAVLAPQQTAANNPNRCFNWFSPRDVTRGEGEVASIAAMIAQMIRTYDLDTARVFITGLSAGGAMTMAMLATYPELFAAGAVIAGLPYGVAQDMMQAITAMHVADPRPASALGRLVPSNAGPFPRLTVWHGEADHVVSSGNAEAIVAQWALAQGLPSPPTGRAATGARTRSVWLRDDDGEVAIELNLVRDLGHGVPLSTLEEKSLGRTAPYMLEAGLCSSSEIAKFWGIWREGDAANTQTTPLSLESQVAVSPPRSMLEQAPGAAHEPIGLGGRVLAALDEHVSTDVHEVIAKALRAAGLVR
jgi:poly(hydroxyalkanoate) depolymerase family esterase